MNSGRLVHSATAKLIPDLDATQKKCDSHSGFDLRVLAKPCDMIQDPAGSCVAGTKKTGTFSVGPTKL